MRKRTCRIAPTLEGLEDRKLLSNDGFGQTNAFMAQVGYANVVDTENGQTYANYGQLHADFAHGNGETGVSGPGLGGYNSTGGDSKLDTGTAPPGQS
jgi:hypothetical protein